MNNKDIFDELFRKLSLEDQRKVLAIVKDFSTAEDNEQVGSADAFHHIDYRELYQRLFFEVGRHVDGIIQVMHQLEEIHLREPDQATIIDLHPPED